MPVNIATDLTQIAPGTLVPPGTTIDALFSALYPVRSSDLGSATYSWAEPGVLIGYFLDSPTATIMVARFEARPHTPSVLASASVAPEGPEGPAAERPVQPPQES